MSNRAFECDYHHIIYTSMGCSQTLVRRVLGEGRARWTSQKEDDSTNQRKVSDWPKKSFVSRTTGNLLVILPESAAFVKSERIHCPVSVAYCWCSSYLLALTVFEKAHKSNTPCLRSSVICH